MPVTPKPRRAPRAITQQQWWRSPGADEVYWGDPAPWPDAVPITNGKGVLRDEDGREWEAYPFVAVRTVFWRPIAEDEEEADALTLADVTSFANWWRWWKSRGRLLVRRTGRWPIPGGDADATPPMRELQPPAGYYERRRRGRR